MKMNMKNGCYNQLHFLGSCGIDTRPKIVCCVLVHFSSCTRTEVHIVQQPVAIIRSRSGRTGREAAHGSNAEPEIPETETTVRSGVL